MRILSLGGGVQSSTLLLMAERGAVDRPDYAIFADTGWEPRSVYAHLKYLCTQTSIPILTVGGADIRKNALREDGGHFTTLPVYVLKADGTIGMLQRQCTKDFKITPIRRKVRELNGGKCTPTVEQYIGISLDEVVRMKPSGVNWIKHRWPLIEKHMRRGECVEWLRANGYQMPPKSACIGCPYTDDVRWADRKKNDLPAWADAVEADAKMRNLAPEIGKYFLHRSCLPLDQVDFSTDSERGQSDMFTNECEGMCGV